MFRRPSLLVFRRVARAASSSLYRHAVLTAGLTVALPVSAATATWTGTSGAPWSTPSNWSTGLVPDASDEVAVFTGTTPVSVTGTFTVGRLQHVPTGSLAIGDANLTNDGLILATSGTTVPEIEVANGGGNLFIYTTVSGTQGFTKTGLGRLTFRFQNAADNVFTGPITIASGVLGFEKASSLGDASNSVVIANGAKLLHEASAAANAAITFGASRTIYLTGTAAQIGVSTGTHTLAIQGPVLETVAGAGLVKTDNGRVNLSGSLGYTGNTLIASGTLGLSGAAILPAGGNVRFSGGAAAGLDLGSTQQVIRGLFSDNTGFNRTLSGSAASLTVNGDDNLTLAGSNGVTYNFSGLGAFTFDRATRSVAFQTSNATVSATADFNLARAGTAGGVNVLTAASVTVGGGASSGSNGHRARVHLGTSNTIHSGSLKIGAFNGAGTVDFQAGLTAPVLKLRGTSGTSAMDTLYVGETSSGTRTGEGTLDLTGGSLDALVTNVSVARYVAAAPLAHASTFTMPAGTLDAGTLMLGEMTANDSPQISGTINQAGGLVKVGTLTMGQSASANAPDFRLSYNLAGGTLRAGAIQSGTGNSAGTSVRRIGWTGGTIANYDSSTDLNIAGTSGSGGKMILAISGTAAKGFDVDAGRTITLDANTSITGTEGISKNGAGNLRIQGTQIYLGTVTVNAGTLTIDSAVTFMNPVIASGTLTGSGTVSALTLNTGAIAPGTGLGSIRGSSLLWNGGALKFDLSGLSSSDTLVLTGALTKGTGPAYEFDFLGGGLSGGSYTLLTFGSTTFVNTDFAATNLGTGLAGSFVVSGTSLVLNVVPEPSTLGIVLFGGALLLRRRRS